MTIEAEQFVIDGSTAVRETQGLAKRFAVNGRVRIGAVIILIAVTVALVGPFLAPYSPTALVDAPYGLATADHLLGTDSLGRDVLSRFLAGGRDLVWMAVAATAIAIGLGTAIGMSSAYWRGWIEQALMRLADVMLAFPGVVFVLLFVTMFGPGRTLLVVLVGLTQAPYVARVMRGASLQVVQREYVQWAEAVGISGPRVILREILPNVSSPLLVETGLRLMWSTAMLASLSFIGYGIQPPQADWGLMINENRNAITIQPWAVLAPILGIAAFTIGGSLLAEGISRVLSRTDDPS